jgi:adenine-specific DNA-methyltransferase
MTDNIIESLPLNSLDMTDYQKQKLKALFPEVFTEGDKIDFERLRLTLGETIDAGKERFGLQWAGKSDCMQAIKQSSIATLTPARDESLDFDNTENIYIEGDNLEVLKLLQKSYLGKIKMIYIDPPYNTGNEFIYPDNYSENLNTYLEYTGQIDNQGRAYSTNKDTDGRFHSKWLNMMYPRLFLAKNLLREDGVIFISIDDNEVHHLRALCDEIFGEENFIDSIIWKKRYGGGAKEKFLVSIHEYTLLYAKNKSIISNFHIPLDEGSIERYYKNKDENFKNRGAYRTHPLEAMKSFDTRENLYFPIIAPNGEEVYPKRQWRWSRERVEVALKNGEIEFSKDKNNQWVLSSKQYLKDEDGEVRSTKPFSIIDDIFTQHGTNEMINIFGNAKIFDFPKPSQLLAKLTVIGLNESKDDIILDFFSGSATTAHAVMQLNAEDGGSRKYIMVQLPEPCESNSEAYKAGFKTIADIGKERIRRAAQKITTELNNNPQSELEQALNPKPKLDLGFKVFKLQASNFKVWDAGIEKTPETLQRALDDFIDHIHSTAEPEALLYELLLKSGFELTTPIKKLSLQNKTVFSIASGELFICLEQQLTHELITDIAKQKPKRVICLDEGFQNNDALKTNAVLIMKNHGVEVFKTV